VDLIYIPYHIFEMEMLFIQGSNPFTSVVRYSGLLLLHKLLKRYLDLKFTFSRVLRNAFICAFMKNLLTNSLFLTKKLQTNIGKKAPTETSVTYELLSDSLFTLKNERNDFVFITKFFTFSSGKCTKNAP